MRVVPSSYLPWVLPSFAPAEIWNSNQSEYVVGLFEVTQNCHFNGKFVFELTLVQNMAEQCRRIEQILEREDRELEEAMKEQVGTIFHSTSCLNNVNSFKVLIETGIIVHHEKN